MDKKVKIVILLAIAALLCGGAVWFFMFRDSGSEEVWDPNANAPQGNQTVAQGVIGGEPDSDLGKEDDGTTHVELPSSDEDGVGKSDGENTYTGEVDDDGIPTPDAVKAECKEDASMYGRLVIPIAGINVKLYQSSASSTIKAVDSAAMFTLQNTTMIADKWDQGFRGIQSCAQGSEMYIVTPAGKVTYLCARSEAGTLVGGDINYANGSAVTDSPAGAINCYSQSGSGNDVWVAEFTRDGKTTSFEGRKEDPQQGTQPGTQFTPPTTKPSTDGDTSSGSTGSQSENGSVSEPESTYKDPEKWMGAAGYLYSD